MGKPIEGSLERALAGNPAPQTLPTPQPITQNAPSPANGISNPADYIFLEGQNYVGNNAYDDTLVSMDLTHKGKNWNEAHVLLQQEGAYMLKIRQFVDFLNLLKSGKAFDGTGKLVNQSKLTSILDEIWTVRSPWRSEWLDAKFEKKGGTLGMGGDMYINHGHKIVNGQPQPLFSDKLASYLSSDKQIDHDSLLANANQWGLPRPDIKAGSLYYWSPANGKVAGFFADSDGAYLFCVRIPSVTNSYLGVRAVRKKI